MQKKNLNEKNTLDNGGDHRLSNVKQSKVSEVWERSTLQNFHEYID